MGDRCTSHTASLGGGLPQTRQQRPGLRKGSTTHSPNKHAESDSGACFGCGQLRSLQPACSQSRTGSYKYPVNFPHSIPPFQRRPEDYRAKPARIRSGWPGQVLAKRIWSLRTDCGRTQSACYQFPTFRLGYVLPQTTQIILLCKPSPDPI